jgi:DNA-binding MarR family transcriptional regulator
MNQNIIKIYDSLQEIAWNFGSHGVNGECCEDISFVEFIALKNITKGNEYSIQEIGNVLNFTKSGATRIINRLEKKGYVLRKNSPIDGRICCVTSTEKGNETIANIMMNYTMYIEKVLSNYDQQKVELIGEVLQDLINAVHQNMQITTNRNIMGGE